MRSQPRKTKIVCTIGPTSEEPEVIRKLIQSGMNVARLNFSHGDHDSHKAKAELIKRIAEEENRAIALLMDTMGPEIRLGAFPDGPVELEQGAEVRICHEDVEGNEQQFSVTYKEIDHDVVPGARILIDDGLVELEVQKKDGRDLLCTVLNSGEVSSHKSINLPGTDVSLPSMTEQDMADIAFGVENDFDFIAASFVRRSEDVMNIRRLLDKLGGSDIMIIAKIENRQGVSNFEEILDASDGIMVARGDLGVEIPAFEVPTVQKRLISRCYQKGKPCITATQMLDSMIRHPRPTRAEASDVANAILDGTSAIMLSGETANGLYPIEAVLMMDKIARFTETNYDYWSDFSHGLHGEVHGVSAAVSHAACMTAMDVKAKAIVAVTHSGRTARQMSRFRPACPIIATTVSPRTRRQLALSWGVTPFLSSELHSTDQLFEAGLETALNSGIVDNGDLVVLSAGTPVGMSGTTNTMKVANVGQIIVHGTGLNGSMTRPITGDAFVITDLTELPPTFSHKTAIIVTRDTNNSMISLLRQALAIVVENPDPNSHAVTVAETLDIPIIYGAENCTRLVSNGQTITVDAQAGMVS